MDKKEIKDYLRRADELGAKLTGEDEETYTWLIYGYNQCAKLLNETERQCQKQKGAIDKAIELLGNYKHYSTPDEKQNSENEDLVNNAFDILKEVE